MSDGTLRALGILVAIFQSSNGTSSRVPLVAIEEPDMALHPAAAGILRDSLRDASRHTQLLVTSLLKPAELERAVDLASRKAGNDGIVIVLIDSDGDCPAEHGPILLARAMNGARGSAVAVVLAHHEYENWFLAAAESLKGKRGLGDDLVSPTDPESIQGAKGWLSRHIKGSRAYSPTLDQPALTNAMNLDAARLAQSFDKLVRDLQALLGLAPEVSTTRA